MLNNKRSFKCLLFVLIIFFIFIANPVSAQSVSGQKAADFSLEDLEGKSVSLSDFAGRFVLLFFWASWCYHCVKMFPALDELKNDFPPEEIEILAVNFQERPSRLMQFRQQYDSDLKILLDNQGKVFNLYNVYGIPVFVLVDRQGIIRYRGLSLPRRLSDFVE